MSGGKCWKCGCRQWAKTGRKSLRRYRRRSEVVAVVLMKETREDEEGEERMVTVEEKM